MVTNNLMEHQQGIGRSSPSLGRPFAPGAPVLALLTALVASSCATPEPKALLRVTDVETYWVLDYSRTEKRFLAPAVRFRVENISQETLVSVDATVAFYRDGQKDSWGSGYFRLTEARRRVAPGTKILVTMSSDARYSIEGAPESAFSHPTFKPVSSKFFLRVGSSPWVEFGQAPVENVLGSKDARALIEASQ